MYLDYEGSLSPPTSLMESGGDNDGDNSSSMEDKLSDFISGIKILVLLILPPIKNQSWIHTWMSSSSQGMKILTF